MKQSIVSLLSSTPKSFRATIVIMACLLFAQCGKHGYEPRGNADFLPATPEYADPSQWYNTSRNAVADVFYITSTETGDYTLADGTP